MKILQINKLYHPVIGGIETVVKNIAEGLNNHADFKIEVLVCQEKGKRSIDNLNGIKVHRAASWGKKLGMPLSLDFFKLFWRIKNDYDLFILHYPFPLAAFITPFIPKKKLIIYYHSDIVRQKLGAVLLAPFIKYSLKKAKIILSGSHNLIQSSPYLRQVANKCQVLPFGYKIEYNQEDERQAKNLKTKYGKDEVLLLAVGRLVYYKGFEYAIRAMEGIRAKLLIIGAGPEKDKLEQLITKFNLQETISIIAPQPDLKPFFLAADIFLFPSTERSEAFGLVQLEALAAGKPVINTYLRTGVEEVSLNNISGLTVEAKNDKALHQAIDTLVKDRMLREKLGAQGRQRYQESYTLARFTDNFRKILEQ